MGLTPLKVELICDSPSQAETQIQIAVNYAILCICLQETSATTQLPLSSSTREAECSATATKEAPLEAFQTQEVTLPFKSYTVRQVYRDTHPYLLCLFLQHYLVQQDLDVVPIAALLWQCITMVLEQCPRQGCLDVVMNGASHSYFSVMFRRQPPKYGVFFHVALNPAVT